MMTTKKSELFDTILEKYLDGDLDLDETMTLSTKLSEVDDTVTEGANLDIISILNNGKKEFRVKFGQFKKEVKKGKSSRDAVNKLYKELNELLVDLEKRLNKIPITLGSTSYHGSPLGG